MQGTQSWCSMTTTGMEWGGTWGGGLQEEGDTCVSMANSCRCMENHHNIVIILQLKLKNVLESNLEKVRWYSLSQIMNMYLFIYLFIYLAIHLFYLVQNGKVSLIWVEIYLIYNSCFWTRLVQCCAKEQFWSYRQVLLYPGLQNTLLNIFLVLALLLRFCCSLYMGIKIF